MRLLTRASLALAFLCLMAFKLPGTFLTDKRIIEIPQAGEYPAKGRQVVDPQTGLKIIRVADHAELTGTPDGHQTAQSLIVYSRYTPSNTTGEFVLVHGDNSTTAWVYRVKDNGLATILRFKPEQGQASRTMGEVNELRWDYTGQHPYRLYFVGNSMGSQGQGSERPAMSFYLVDIDPVTGQQSVPALIHDFSADFPAFASVGTIMNDVEGDSSIDSRYWAWQVMDTTRGAGYLPLAVFTFDKQAGKVIAALQRSCTGALVPCVALDTPAAPKPYLSRPNMVEVSPLGTRVVVDWEQAYAGWNDANIGTVADGPKAFRLDFSDPIRIGADATHSGWAWGAKGEELFVSQNNRNDWIEAVDIATADTAKCTVIAGNSYSCGTKILAYGDLDGGTWSTGMHFGKFYKRSKRGLAYISTYDKTYQTWGKNQNLFVAINDATQAPTTVYRLGSTCNLYRDYRSEGSGALDFAGRNVWITGNWGFTDGRGDVFRIDLPARWHAGI